MSPKEEVRQELYNLPEDYLAYADEFMPYTREEVLGTFCSTWEIEGWSSLESQVRGPIFKTNDHEWNVLLYPTGNNTADCISLYLESVDCKNGGEDICAQVILCVVDPTDHTRAISQHTQHRFDTREKDYGFTQFTSLRTLYGEDGDIPYINDDSLTIVTIVRLIKDPTGVLWHSFINYNSKEMTGHVGLYNQGATCYMNSLFQSLFFTNIYRKAVFQIPTENESPESSSVYALQRLFYNLQVSESAVSTTELTKSFGWNSFDSFMQHDVQEFNRLLQDNIEKKMKGTPAEDSIKKIFVGKMKSYIKCINVDYESARTEDYYDIQLNVKGCKNLEESFKDYVSVETLEGENKYMAEGHGLQDARKGVIFESFPPVLHLQLKRFEYDMIGDSMVKINDRHEFPTEIDLEPFLSESADKSESHKYNLHGVLVHTGDLSGGHYFAFVRPEEKNEWFKFDDDRVTPATLMEVLEDNFGGEDLAAPTKSEDRFTNAYMLVYIRESQTKRVLEKVTEKDIPSHLVQRINQEKLVLEEFHKLKAQQHLYMKAYIATEHSFLMNRGAGFFQFDESRPTDPPTVVVEHVLKSQTLGEYIKAYSDRYGIASDCLRVWNLANRRNGDVQLHAPFTAEHYHLSFEQICQRLGNCPFIRLYIEYAEMKDNVPIFHPFDSNIALIFVKLFDPVTQTLSGIGKLHIAKDGLVADALDRFKALANFDNDTEIDLYEELGQGQMNKLDPNKTFGELSIGDGDIICFQQQVEDLPISDQSLQYFYTTVPEYIKYLYHRIYVVFALKYPTENPYECQLELRRDMLYDEVVLRLGHRVGCDPRHIQLSVLDYYGAPTRPIKPTEGMTLLDILLQLPKSKTHSRRHEEHNGYLLSKVYFQVLSMDLSVYQTKKLVKIHIVYPLLHEDQKYVEFCLPKTSSFGDVAQLISPESHINIYQVANCKFVKEFRPEELVGVSIKEEDLLCAEVVPKEMKEEEEKKENFKIPVFHYEREITQTHSIPFNFLIIKDEEFHETAKRLQERTRIMDEDWEKVKVEIVSKLRKITIKEDNYKLSDFDFKQGDEIALNYTDPHGKYKTLDRGLYIKE